MPILDFGGERLMRLTFNWSTQCYEKELFFQIYVAIWKKEIATIQIWVLVLILYYYVYIAILVTLSYLFLPVDIEDIVETLPVPEKYY
jgi:hypothetical protein